MSDKLDRAFNVFLVTLGITLWACIAALVISGSIKLICLMWGGAS